MFGGEGDVGRVYVRERGTLRAVNTPGREENRFLTEARRSRFHELENRLTCSDRDPIHSVRSLHDLSIEFIGANIDHVVSLMGFPEQIAENLFKCAERKQKFVDPGCSVRSLQVFSESYGDLILKSLCLRER